MKISPDNSRFYHICRNCPQTQLTLYYIFDCKAILATLFKLDALPHDILFSTRAPDLASLRNYTISQSIHLNGDLPRDKPIRQNRGGSEHPFFRGVCVQSAFNWIFLGCCPIRSTDSEGRY
ncbi:UNVERIFIED_CONTAM: hypothetical protein NCL1_47702 [Trichonephila clavipes]